MATITEDYVNFKTAKLLKEKGFNEECMYFYDWDEEDEIYRICSNGGSCNEARFPSYYSMPTLQMAMKWLRKVHNIDIIAPPQYDNIKWTYSAVIFKLSIPYTEIRLNDNKDKKEEAFETAIKYCLENLI